MALDSPHTPQTPIYLTTTAAAERMELSVETVRDFCERDVLRDAVQDHPRGPWRIPVVAVDKWLQRNKPTLTDRPASEISRQLELPPPPIEHNAPPTAWERFRHHPWVFYPTVAFTIIAALVTVVTALISAGADLGTAADQWRQLFGIRVFSRERDNEILIVIATFDRAEGVDDARPHIKIRDAIRTAAHDMNFSHLRIEVEPTVLASDARTEAETLGQRYNASIVIWGEETSVNVTVNFLNRKEPAFVASETQITETERNFTSSFARPDPYSRFMNEDLPGQLTFLTLYAVGQSYYSSEAYTDAAATIERAIASLPPNVQLAGVAEAYFSLGWLNQGSLKDNAKALENYNQAVQHNPNLVSAYNNRGVVYRGYGNLDAAMADYSKAIQLKPDYAEAYNNRGNAHVFQDNRGDAIADYNQAIKLDLTDTYFNRGTAYLNWGEFDSALADLNKAIELKPDDVEAYNNRGVVRRAQGDFAGAITDYNRAIELKLDYAEAYVGRGVAYADQGGKVHLEAAIADFDKAIQLKSDYVDAYYDRGITHHEQGILDLAIADFDKAIQLNPDYADAYNSRGAVHAAQYKWDAAMADFTKAIELKPNYAEAYYNRGNAYYNQRDLELALTDYNQTLILDPNTVRAYYNRGITHTLKNDFIQAIADFEFFVTKSKQQGQYESERQQAEAWIIKLKAGENPFE